MFLVYFCNFYLSLFLPSSTKEYIFLYGFSNKLNSSYSNYGLISIIVTLTCFSCHCVPFMFTLNHILFTPESLVTTFFLLPEFFCHNTVHYVILIYNVLHNTSRLHLLYIHHIFSIRTKRVIKVLT